MSESGRDRACLRSDEHPLGYIEEILINILPRLPAKTVGARSDEHPLGYIEEILINILPRLPAKTVGACKSVAKHFLKLTSEPGFPLMHFTMSKRKLKYIICPYPRLSGVIDHLFVMEDGKISEDRWLPGAGCRTGSEMSCFRNGLVCSVHDDRYGETDVDIKIFNALTLDTYTLPRGSTSAVRPTVGVAFDPISNDYKAFRFFSDSVETVDKKYSCEVYTATSKAWRTIATDVKCPEHSPYDPLCPFYASVGGVMYWFVWSDEDQDGIPASIFSVDMNDNFTEIDLPAELNERSFLIEFEGCLAVVHMNSELSEWMELKIFKLEKGGWNLRLRTMMMVDLYNVSCFNSIAAIDNEIFFILQLEDESFKFIIFDFVEETFQILDDLVKRLNPHFPVAFPYAESLLLS